MNKKRSKRRWLNSRKDRTAYIVTDVNVETWKSRPSNKSHTNLFASVQIKDCSRQITLDFDGETKRERASAIKKLDILMEELSEFKKFLLECHEGLEK